MDGVELDEKVMKLLHFFITEQGYNPIILHGAKNEIWLENLDSDYSIVRIVTNYIHNDEQFNFDLFKTNQIVKKIKRKTFSFKLKTLSIFLNLGENVKKISNEDYQFGNIDCVEVSELDDLDKYSFIKSIFPNIVDNTKFSEDGFDLYMKITKDINEKNEKDNIETEELFKKKVPVVTIGLIAINIILFFLTYFASGSNFNTKLVNMGGLTKGHVLINNEFWRLVTSMFLHGGLIHLLVNCYSLLIIGSQIESFYGKIKYFVIYLMSGIAGNLLSLLFIGDNIVSIGASGAIFGLLGSLLYFGYHFRVFLATVIRNQIIPIIILNLGIGFIFSGINNFAHIGGLIGGLLISMLVGIKYKSTTSDRVNGIIMSLIYYAALIFMVWR